jgi:hypothetical protein
MAPEEDGVGWELSEGKGAVGLYSEKRRRARR